MPAGIDLFAIQINVAFVIYPTQLEPYLLIASGRLLKGFHKPVGIMGIARIIYIFDEFVVHPIIGIGDFFVVQQGSQYRSRYGSRHPAGKHSAF
ncbi:hypothetical protein D3C87_1548200 [compost metagenome]